MKLTPQHRPFQITITPGLRRTLRANLKQSGKHWGVHFDTSGNAHAEPINPSAQYDYVWRTDK